mmetsp:Transcript_35876/g.113453  ORF Transcript_35876/g.113453 Transcript_35876/m.113453 type:complete len:290 (+) Transcript_35876:335-1204(+)
MPSESSSCQPPFPVGELTATGVTSASASTSCASKEPPRGAELTVTSACARATFPSSSAPVRENLYACPGESWPAAMTRGKLKASAPPAGTCVEMSADATPVADRSSGGVLSLMQSQRRDIRFPPAEAEAWTVTLSCLLTLPTGGYTNRSGGSPFSTSSEVCTLACLAPLVTVTVKTYSRAAPEAPPRSATLNSASRTWLKSTFSPAGPRHGPPPCEHSHAKSSMPPTAPSTSSGSKDAEASSRTLLPSPTMRPPPEMAGTSADSLTSKVALVEPHTSALPLRHDWNVRV